MAIVFALPNLGHNKSECQICGKVFDRSKNGVRDLLNHKKFHEKPTEWKCEFCNKSYKYNSNLKIHLKTCQLKKKMEQSNISKVITYYSSDYELYEK